MAQLVEMVKYVYHFDCRTIYMLHVRSSGTHKNEKIEKQLAMRASKLQIAHDISIYTRIRSGHAATEVVQEAREHDVECIYVAWRNKNFFYHTLLGSTTKDMVRMAHRPVFVYKRLRKVAPGREGKIGTLLFPTDFGHAARRAKGFIARLAPYVENLVILHVGRRAADPSSEEKRKLRVREKLSAVRKDFGPHFAAIEDRVVVGNEKKHILDTAHRYNADLIVTGRFNKTAIGAIFGSTSETVADRSECSVLIVP
jgi:nucleotide-binding universal stress UspA family protein